jgi:hypothetical protein
MVAVSLRTISSNGLDETTLNLQLDLYRWHFSRSDFSGVSGSSGCGAISSTPRCASSAFSLSDSSVDTQNRLRGLTLGLRSS